LQTEIVFCEVSVSSIEQYKKLHWSFNDTSTWKRDQMPHPQQVSCFP